MRGRWLGIATVLFGVSLVAGAGMRRRYAPRFPPLAELQGGPFAFQDATLAAAGLRAPAADLAWIQLLQYTAGSLPELIDPPDRPYGHLAKLSLRVARLDPSFDRAVLFGAGILAWFHGIERPDEAAELLHDGMRHSPDQKLYPLYLAALAYQKQGDTNRMVALLESSFDLPETPTQMKAILANLRQSRGELRESLTLWERILANERDASEHGRARAKITELRAALRARR
jgi:hypothetical protein